MRYTAYLFTLKHDNGTVRIKVWGFTKAAAKRRLMSAEGCPESAIIGCVAEPH